MAGQYNYAVAGNPPQYSASQQQQFQPGVRLSQQQQQGPVLAPPQPAMMVAAPSAPIIVQQLAVEPRFNPCICCNVISAPGTSLRRGATLAGVAHLVHGLVALTLWIIMIKGRYEIKHGQTAESRDHDRIYRRLRTYPAYTVWSLTNIVVFDFPCAFILLIAAARMTKLLAQTYVIWNISGLISYIVSVIVESVIVHDLRRKVYLETGEDAVATYRIQRTVKSCIVVLLYVYLLTVGASLSHYLRDIERKHGALAMGPAAAAAPVSQMTGVYASANDNEAADENVS